jgi:hypothetical protein
MENVNVIIEERVEESFQETTEYIVEVNDNEVIEQVEQVDGKELEYPELPENKLNEHEEIEDNKADEDPKPIEESKASDGEQRDRRAETVPKIAPLLSLGKVAIIKPVINDHINNLMGVRNSANLHAGQLISIFKLLNENAFRKVNNTLNLSRKFTQYFRDVTTIYSKFSYDIGRSNVILASCTQDTILSDNINIMIEKTQEAIAGKFISFSNILFTNIVNKGPFLRVKELESRLNKISKEVNLSLAKVEQKREKIAKVYTGKMLPIFESITKSTDDTVLQVTLDKNEVYLMEVELLSSLVKMYTNIEEFFKMYRTNMNDIKTLVLEFMSVIKEAVELYLNENKKIFSDNTYANMDNMKRFHDSLTEEYLQNAFNLDNILSDKVIKDYFNDTLRALQSTLLKFSETKQITNQDLLNNNELFDISKFNSVESFVDFISGFMPKDLEGDTVSPMVQLQCQVRRDPGVFSSWRNAWFVITIQESLLISDESVGKKPCEKFKLKRLRMKITPDKKTPFKFDISEKKKFMFFNTNASCVVDPLSKEALEEISDLVQKIQKDKN